MQASNLTFLYFIWKAAPRPIGIPSPMKANPPSCVDKRLSVAKHCNAGNGEGRRLHVMHAMHHLQKTLVCIEVTEFVK